MTARKVALEALMRIEGGEFSNRVLNDLLKDKNNLDQAFVRALVYGVLQEKLYLDYIISKSSKIKLKKIENIVLSTLRIGLYQILFMKVEDYASVNETVKLVANNPRRKSFVNGVLRDIQRNILEYSKIDLSDKLDYLSIKYSHPRDLIEYLQKYYNLDFIEKILAANNQKANLAIRINSLKIDLKELKKIFDDKNIEYEDSSISSYALRISSDVKLTNLEEFKKGFFTIQAEPSIYAAERLNPKRGAEVLDICAAPGSKTTFLAQLMQNEGRIIANDLYEGKLKKIEDNCKRLGVDIVRTCAHDASVYRDDWKERFDYILCDLPCSGLGLLRRKPDIRWNFNLEEIDGLVKLQAHILLNAYTYLKSGGTLVYSTCTYGDLENKVQVENFLSNHKDCSLVGKMKYFCTAIDNTDGFFVAKIRKE